MNKHASTTLPCPADKVAAPSRCRVKTAATIYRCLLNTFCVLLLLCIASPSVHAMKQAHFEKKTEITKEVRRGPYVIENMSTMKQPSIYYIYNSEARVRTTRSHQWQFVYSRESIFHAQFDWETATSFGNPSILLDFDAFFRITTAPGYYLFRTTNTRTVPIFIPGIYEFTASALRAQIPDNGYGQIDLSTYIEGEGNIIYRIEDYIPGNVFIFCGGKQIPVDENGQFKIQFYGGNYPQKISLCSAKTGTVKIQVEHVSSKKSLYLSFERKGKSLLVLRNANDSNNDNEADYKSRDPVTNDDPDLFKLNILALANGMPQGIMDFSGEPVQLILKIPAAFNIYSSARKTAFGPVSAVEGYHLVYHWHLTPENLNSILQTLDNIYLEGVVLSAAPNDYEITFEIISPRAELSRKMQWTASIIDLFINRSMLPESYQVAPGLVLPRIKNPAVISYAAPGSNPTRLDQLGSLFEVQSSNMEMLEHFQDQIEWALYAEEGTRLVQFFPEGAMFGKSIQLQAVEDGYVIIGVRLRGADTDYLQITRPVVPMKTIPVSFQFFTENYTSTSQVQYEKFVTSIPDILLCMNLIARQSGILFHTVDPNDPGTRSSFLDKLSFTVESEDETPFIPRWISTKPPVLPLIKTKNKYIIANPPHEWVGSILGFQLNNETGRFDIMKGSFFAPFNIGKKFAPLPPIQYPALIKPDIPDQRPLLYQQGALVYQNVPSWIIENARAYTMAISSANNAVSFNFLPAGDFGNGEIDAITSIPSPSPQMVPIDTGRRIVEDDNAQHFVRLSHSNDFHLFPVPYEPGEPHYGHACVTLSLPGDYTREMRSAFISNYARKLIPAALRTLGLRERSIMGELDAYQDQELLNTALQQKILLYHEGRLIINPVTPLTAHENAVINPYDDILSLDLQQQYGYRIDESRTALLRQHPFTIPK